MKKHLRFFKRQFLLIILVTFLNTILAENIFAQFDYGTGSEGAYTAPGGNSTLSGTHNYTTFTIPTGSTVTAFGNSPLIIKCQGTATISGTLIAAGNNGSAGSAYSGSSAPGGAGGTGGGGGWGAAGGNGGAGITGLGSGNNGINGLDFAGTGGHGYGGHYYGGANTISAGTGGSYGTLGLAAPSTTAPSPGNGLVGNIYSDANLTLVETVSSITTNLLGGSGGGGGGPRNQSVNNGNIFGGSGGGGGGGAIQITADAISIGANALISVRGGDGGSDTHIVGAGGGGSGGTINFQYNTSLTGVALNTTPTFIAGSTLDIAGGTGGIGGSTASPYTIGGDGGQGRYLAQQDAVAACSAPNLVAMANSTAITLSLCGSANIAFTSNATGGAGCSGNFEYAWSDGSNYWNGSAFSSGVAVYNSSYANIDANIANTASFTVTARCSANLTCISNSTVTVNINSPVTPTLTISASNDTVCARTPVTFNANGGNGGSSPGYQWFKNNVSVGTNSSSYTGNNLTNGDVITCTLTSNATCASPTTVSSNSITITVNSIVAPTITISVPQNSICAGTSLTFTANPGNGGTAPVYQWYKNGGAVGTNSTTYTDNSLSNNDTITCSLTSNAMCITSSTVTSAPIIITVNANVTPTINISTNQPTICTGTPVTFYAVGLNGGITPLFYWKKNGNDAGVNSSYTDNSLVNNDVITCEYISSNSCSTPDTVESNAITMSVVAAVSAGTISTAKDTICENTVVHLTVTGSSGNIQWQSSSPTNTNFTGIAGATSGTFTSGLLIQDTYFRVMANNGVCADSSNMEYITVLPAPNAAFTFTPNGLSVTFNSGGSVGATSYSWDFGDNSSLGTQPNPVHSYANPGTYHVCLTVKNSSNCNFTVCQNIEVSSNGVDNINGVSEIKVYPNPFGDELFISTGANNNIENVKAFDVLGRTVLYKNCVNDISSPRQLNVSEFKKGVYYLKIKTREGEYFRSVIKE